VVLWLELEDEVGFDEGVEEEERVKLPVAVALE